MYGRAGDLAKLYRDKHDVSLPKDVRQRADRAMQVIRKQLADKALMGMREQLIRATRAGDQAAAQKIELRMRDHEGADRETGQ